MTRGRLTVSVLTFLALVACAIAGVGGSGASFTANQSNAANLFSTGDWTPPAVTLTAPAANARLGSGAPTFSGAAGTDTGDLSTVTVRIYSGADTTGALAGTVTTTASGSSWSATPGVALGDGTYTAQASQGDASGNTGRSAAVTFTVDTTAPAPTVTAPSAYVGTGAPTISGAAGNATGDAATVSVAIRQGATVVQTLTATRSGTTWSATPSPALAAGTYTATATQSDDVGNTGASAARTFTVDLTAPAVTVTTPNAGTSFPTRTPLIAGGAGTAGGDLNAITVKIYSGAGTGGSVVQTLTPTASSGSWSATPASLADGVYTAQATQADQAGNNGTSSAVTFTVDNVAPAPTVTAPSGTVGTATPTISGTAGNATGDNGSVSVEVLSGTTVVRTFTPSRTATTWSVAVSPALPDGAYTARVTQGDAAGNSATSAASAFTVDTTAPVVSIAAPTSGGTSTGTPAISGTAGNLTGDSSTVTVKLYSGTGTGGTLLQTLTSTRSGTSWSATAAALGDGTYTVQASQADSAGNTGTSSPITFTVDATAPAPAITAPTGYVTTATPALSGTAGNATGDSTTVSVAILSGASTVQTLTPTRTGTTWSATAAALADGTYTAKVTQTDAAGNSGTSSAITFTVDTTTPAPAVTAPGAGSSTNSTTPTLSGTAGTASGDAASVTVKVYNGSGTGGTVNQTKTAAVSSGAWSVTASTLTDGTYTVQATQTDAAGHTGNSTAVTFTVDTVAPLAPVVTAPSVWATSQTPTISGTAANGTGDSTTVTVEILSGASVVQTLSATRTGTTWSVAVPAALTEGSTYTARARQGDAAGNTSLNSAPLAFTVDSTPPAVTLTAPAASAYTNNTTPTFSGAAGTATTDLPTVTVRIYNASNALVQTRTATAVAGAWSVAASPALAQGTYTATASQSDTPGNVGTTAATTFTIDTTAPTATSVTTTNVAGGTAGVLDAGDTISFAYSEAMDPASIVAGWTGAAGTTVTLNFINNANNDTFTVTDASGNPVHLATNVALNANVLKKNWTTTGTLTRATATTFTITLSAAPPNSVIAPNPAAGANIAWTADTAAKDLAGNALTAGTVTQTGNGVDF